MKPKWQLVWPRKYAHSSFSSLVQSLLPNDTLLRTYFKKKSKVYNSITRDVCRLPSIERL